MSQDNGYLGPEGTLARHVRAAVGAENALIERELEAAIATGTDGVAVIRTRTEFTTDPDDVYRAERSVHVAHTPDVPYGQIYEFPSLEAYREYLVRGEEADRA